MVRGSNEQETVLFQTPEHHEFAAAFQEEGRESCSMKCSCKFLVPVVIEPVENDFLQDHSCRTSLEEKRCGHMIDGKCNCYIYTCW